jgi:hypothetical protein
MEHELKVKIEGLSKEKAIEVLTDLLSIRKSLRSDADVKALAKLLLTNPGIIETAKKFLG